MGIRNRKCYKCKKVLEENLVNYFKNNARNGFSSMCKKCHVLDISQRRKSEKYLPQYIYQTSKGNAKRRGILFSMTQECFCEWYKDQEKKCSYCSISQETVKKLKWHHKNLSGSIRLTIDRMDNKLGYIISNITLACYFCNFIKGELLSFNEMKEIGQKYIKPKWDN